MWVVVWKQEDEDFKASVSYMRPRLKKKHKKQSNTCTVGPQNPCMNECASGPLFNFPRHLLRSGPLLGERRVGAQEGAWEVSVCQAPMFNEGVAAYL